MRNIPFGKPIIGDEERNAVMEVLQGTQLVHGPKAKQFESDFADFMSGGYATSVASCTAGLHLGYFDLGIGKGDEVIVPAQTHVATAHAVEFTGADCVFVDCDEITGNIDIDAIEAAITERTKAISVVHFLGMPVDMGRINDIAKKHDLFVMEDCALAIGSYYKGKHCGLLGDMGSFSFYPVKHMTTAEGGMVTSKHEDLIRRLERKKAFGVDRTVNERTIPGVYDVTMLGYNYRMNELEAAIGIEQLKRIDGFLDKRRANTKTLRSCLVDLEEVSLLWEGDDDFVSSNYCQSIILSPKLSTKRFEIVKFLKESGVGTSIYYPVPVPYMTYYKEKYGLDEGLFPNASRISFQSISLSVGPHLCDDDMEYTAEQLKKAIASVI